MALDYFHDILDRCYTKVSSGFLWHKGLYKYDILTVIFI